jgi:hypothetical protein
MYIIQDSWIQFVKYRGKNRVAYSVSAHIQLMNQSILDSRPIHTRITRTLEAGAQVDLSTEP